MQKFLDGLSLSMCVLCNGDRPPADCWDGEFDGYSSCAACYGSMGPKERDCGVCLFPEYKGYAARDGRAPYFGVRGSFILSGTLIDSVSRKVAPYKQVMLGFPNGICFYGKSDKNGRFAIRVDSTQGGRVVRVNLGRLRHQKKMKRFLIGFALTSKAARHRRKGPLSKTEARAAK